ncbi:hypothetical protein DY000_02009622 [Brassica cretica]|uniref:Uncharacterized protein n=1 Tax=Brassica cretica TaxID=69181 RepID=A0ABQ7CBD3_BRACR|nr:hypothetical protein DY000_02009622 [Brassica cretica]
MRSSSFQARDDTHRSRPDNIRDSSQLGTRRHQLQLAFPISDKDSSRHDQQAILSRLNINIQLAILISLVVHSTHRRLR